MASRPRNGPRGRIRRIAVAVDGSDRGRKAVLLGIDMAVAFTSELAFVHVVPVSEIPVLMAEAQRPEAIGRGQLLLGSAAKQARARGITATIVLRQGHIADQLLRFVRSSRPDVILLGSRGLSKAAGLLLGSVSQAVAQHARATVIIVR